MQDLLQPWVIKSTLVISALALIDVKADAPHGFDDTAMLGKVDLEAADLDE